MQVHSEDGLAGMLVRERNHHVPIEPSRSEDRGVDHFGMIARAHDNYALSPLDAVELFQEAIDCLDVVGRIAPRCSVA